MKRVLLLAALSLSSAQIGNTETLETACSRSARAAASGILCGCIQEVANLTLTASDQRLALSFFKDPQKAQDIRQSDSSSHEKFWGRYKQFTNAARDLCS